MSEQRGLQDHFLDTLLREKTPVSIFLVNGIKLHGSVTRFDHHVVLLSGAITQMVYKHAISTIVPAHTIDLSN